MLLRLGISAGLGAHSATWSERGPAAQSLSPDYHLPSKAACLTRGRHVVGGGTFNPDCFALLFDPLLERVFIGVGRVLRVLVAIRDRLFSRLHDVVERGRIVSVCHARLSTRIADL